MRFGKTQAPVKVRDQAAELRLMTSRYRFLVFVMMGCLCLLAYRFADLQIINHELYAGQAETNRVSLRALPPTRGLIFDQQGRVLAENRPAYRLVIVPERTPKLESTLASIGELIALSDGDLQRFERQRQRSRRFQSIALKNNLNPEEVATLAAHRHRLPGVEVEPYLTRHYPYGELFAHVLGYVGRIDSEDLQRLGPERYRATSHVGRMGIEQAYEGR